MKAGRTARVRVGRGDASSTQQLLTKEGQPAGSRTKPAHRETLPENSCLSLPVTGWKFPRLPCEAFRAKLL